MLKPITVEREICRDYLRSSRLEWLEPNGTGAFAMGSVAGSNTRRYHGLLVASLHPPVERFVLLSKVEETIEHQGQSYSLGVGQYPGTVAPTGYDYLDSFVLDPMPTWTWTAGHITVTRQIFLVPDRQAVIIRYEASAATTLRVRPFMAFRDYHSMGHENQQFNGWADSTETSLRIKPYGGLPALEIRHAGARWEGDGSWYRNVEYLAELDRGLDFREDIFTPGSFVFQLEADTPIYIVAGVESVSDLDVAALYAERAARTYKSRLEAAADVFRATRADGKLTIMAGFPWFTDWGRDTMISLPGLLISRGLVQDAAKILQCFLDHMDQGVIPNLFPDGGQRPEYNTVDGTLWMFIAVKRYLDAGGDPSFLHRSFYPAAKDIISWHRHGTWFGIGVDPSDSLLRAGGPGTQLTWMDAKVGDWVCTPRHGKPVEINALWYNALRLTAGWAAQFGDAEYASEINALADRVRDSFRAKFWDANRKCLYDCIQDEGPVLKMRPNQLFALSLPFPLLDAEQQKSVVRIVEKELLTPVGLRTLDRADPDYRPHYGGASWERDGAYHQGTVWPWLVGPYIDACFAAFGDTAETRAHCEQVASRLAQELTACGLGSIAEVYDADPPHKPGGCPAQAWSVAELLRVTVDYSLNLEAPQAAASSGD